MKKLFLLLFFSLFATQIYSMEAQQISKEDQLFAAIEKKETTKITDLIKDKAEANYKAPTIGKYTLHDRTPN